MSRALRQPAEFVTMQKDCSLSAAQFAAVEQGSFASPTSELSVIIRPLQPLLSAFVLPIALASFWSRASASDIEISIEVKAGQQRIKTTHTEIQPSSKKPDSRPVCTVKPQENIVVSWKAINVSKRDTFKDVLIHCVVVAEKELGQTTMPPLKDPVQESALTMDFKPGNTASGKFSLTIAEPGTYLLRVETREMLNTHGHDHYAALDLVCE